MNTQAVIKAGGVGAVILIVLSVLSYIPCVGCFTLILTLAAYAGIGALAAKWMPPIRTAGQGAGTGAAAAVLAGLIAGLVIMVISAIYFVITGGTAQMTAALQDLPPEQAQMLAEMGIDPAMFAGSMGIVGVLGVGAVCCTLGLIVAAILGAIGGAVWANMRPHQP